MTTLAQSLLGLAILAAALAVVRGPDLTSRVIAFDTGVLALVALLGIDAAVRGNALFLDALPVLGLLAILTTLAARWAMLRTDRPRTTTQELP